MRAIDINADLGEGFGQWQLGDDAGLLDVITSANIACGFHAGDPSIMRRVCDGASERGVAIGAHVGYRDLAGFGRRALAISPAELRDETLYQIGALESFARAAGSRVSYVKPHGALYHSAAADEAAAGALVEAIVEYDRGLSVLGPAGSRLHESALASDVTFVREGFADRAYTAQGTLVDRRRAGAVLAEESQSIDQVLGLVQHSTVRSIDGVDATVEIDSVCVHGDSPHAAALTRAIRHALEAAQVPIKAFA
jgi:UPF0271 protein